MTNNQALLAIALSVFAVSSCDAKPTRTSSPATVVVPVVPPTADRGEDSFQPVSFEKYHRSIVVYMAPFACGPCNALKPELKRLKDIGWNITENYDGAGPYPRIVAYCNDVVVFTHSGYLDADILATKANGDKPHEAKATVSGGQRSSASRGFFRRSFGGCASCR